MSLPPARIASPIADVETPALLIDLDAYERNLDRMVDSLEAYLLVTPPSGLETLPDRAAGGGVATMAIPTAQIDSVAVQALDEAEAAAALEAQAKAEARSATPDESPTHEADSSLEPIAHSNDEALDA